MRRSGLGRRFALGAVCWCLLYAAPLAAQSPTQYVFLIDTSGSMVGLPSGRGHANIFPRVKEELVRYLGGLRLGDVVDIRTFDQGVRSQTVFRIDSERARQDAIAHVRALRAEGQTTWVYRSILATATAKREEARRPGAPEIPTLFYVFTDGLDEDPERMSMREMLRQYAKLRQEGDFLIYVTLGVDLPAEDSGVLDEDPYAAHHREARDVVRIGTVQVRAKRLDFGFVEGDLSASRSLALQLDNLEPSEAVLRLEPRFPEVEAAGAVIEVQPSTVDLESSQEVRLRIINRESLPEGKFAGEIHLAAGQQHVQVVPDHIEAAFSTLPGPFATLTLPGKAQRLEFGERKVGAGGPSELTARVELNASAVAERAGFYLRVAPSRRGAAAPVATWNGEPAGERLLTSGERFNDLAFSWPEAPEEAGTFDGEIRLVGERLALAGEALVAGDEEGSQAVAYRLTMLPRPPPLWLRVLEILAALLALLVVLALVYWIVARKPPWVAARRWMLRAGLAKPQLYGKLVYEAPGGERMELKLAGSEPILLGAGTERWEILPDQIEISPRLRRNGEVVTATPKQGEVLYRSNEDPLRHVPLSAHALAHNDSLILSDEREIIFLAFEHK